MLIVRIVNVGLCNIVDSRIGSCSYLTDNLNFSRDLVVVLRGGARPPGGKQFLCLAGGINSVEGRRDTSSELDR